jgi:hypothetical protein
MASCFLADGPEISMKLVFFWLGSYTTLASTRFRPYLHAAEKISPTAECSSSSFPSLYCSSAQALFSLLSTATVFKLFSFLASSFSAKFEKRDQESRTGTQVSGDQESRTGTSTIPFYRSTLSLLSTTEEQHGPLSGSTESCACPRIWQVNELLSRSSLCLSLFRLYHFAHIYYASLFSWQAVAARGAAVARRRDGSGRDNDCDGSTMTSSNIIACWPPQTPTVARRPEDVS